ncbi:MAG: hypothetical protein NTZ07_02055 [Candidatus Woesebacteria bacterium]|nr:hypothetical protein [Candidatus Woesebacteria bacterium]
MPVKLNLLPQELAVSKGLSSFLKTTKALGVIGIAAFFIFGIGVAAFFIFSTISLNGINANITKLSDQVSSQQKSEQQIILIKDRVTKVASVQALPNTLPNQTAVEPILAGISAASSINQISIDPASVTLSLVLKSNSDLSAFLESFQSIKVFKSVKMTSFNLSPVNGYSVEINAIK